MDQKYAYFNSTGLRTYNFGPNIFCNVHVYLTAMSYNQCLILQRNVTKGSSRKTR